MIKSIQNLLNLLKEHHYETYAHSIRTAFLFQKVLNHYGLYNDKKIEWLYGALLHDIGKIYIPKSTLNKPAPLNDQEWRLLESHAKLGFTMIRETLDIGEGATLVKLHHEREDGLGYYRVPGRLLPSPVQLFSIVDALDAMTTCRPYHEVTLSVEEAKRELQVNAGTQFHRELVQLVCDMPNHLLDQMRHLKEDNMVFTDYLSHEA